MSESKELQNITLFIAKRKYPLKVPVELEGIYREAAKRIGNDLDRYSDNKFNLIDMQDILSMSYLSTTIKLIELEQKREYNVLLEELDKLDAKLADYLEKEKA